MFVPKHRYNSRRAIYIDVDTSRCKFDRELAQKRTIIKSKGKSAYKKHPYLMHPVYAVTMVAKAKAKKVGYACPVLWHNNYLVFAPGCCGPF
jgi:hypothetical protein